MVKSEKIDDIREDVHQAILNERECQGYQVSVDLVRPVHTVLGVHLPKTLEVAYIATTVCTREHGDEKACAWCDYAFFLNGKWRVMLENDLRGGSGSVEENVKQILRKLSQEQVEG